MKIIKYITISFLGLVAFMAAYLSFDATHRVNVMQKQIDSIKVSQSKIEYSIKSRQDTIIIINNLNFSQK